MLKAKLMTHLVANYPNPESFEIALETMLRYGVDFLEVQIPFSNPLADGEVIYKANQKALEYARDIDTVLGTIRRVVDRFEAEIEIQNKSQAESQNKGKNPAKITTKLLLMGYSTSFFGYGIKKLAENMKKCGISGTIIPDLAALSPEQKSLTEAFQDDSMYNIPVISPLTLPSRIDIIKNCMLPNQPIYAMSRKGRTGKSTDIRELQGYLDFLKSNLAGYQIAVGFGISSLDQVSFLNRQGFVAVIGSRIIQLIDATQNLEKDLFEYLKSLEDPEI